MGRVLQIPTAHHAKLILMPTINEACLLFIDETSKPGEQVDSCHRFTE
jgi:hypothetical protein